VDELVAVIPTLDEEHNIDACIESVAWCDRVVVFDSFSTDRTCEISRSKDATVIQHPFKGYASQHQAAMDAIEARWVLFVDADERVTPELADEIRGRLSQEREEVGWWIPRHNYIFGRLTLHAGWYPDYQLRLLRMDRSRWDLTREVHELAILDGPAGQMEHVLIHYNYDSLRQFVVKQERYVEFDARILLNSGERVKLWSPFSMPLRHLKWRFIDLEGYRDGLHGLWLSVLMSYYEGKKYARLAQLRRELA
jgi:glycosyltransferase involved in cell wall biosynthesis